MKHEYDEGAEALARFDKGMTKLFQAPKKVIKEPSEVRKPKGKISPKQG